MAEDPITSLSIIKRIFSNWTALRMTIEHGNGSIDGAHNFCEYLAETLAINENLHYTDISGLLEDYMDESLNTRLEDDSENQVAQDIIRFHNYIITNDMVTLTNELQKMPPLQPWFMPNQNGKFSYVSKMEANSDSDDVDENDQDEEIQNSKQASKSSDTMEVDSEGWSVIRRKKK